MASQWVCLLWNNLTSVAQVSAPMLIKFYSSKTSYTHAYLLSLLLNMYCHTYHRGLCVLVLNIECKSQFLLSWFIQKAMLPSKMLAVCLSRVASCPWALSSLSGCCSPSGSQPLNPISKVIWSRSLFLPKDQIVNKLSFKDKHWCLDHFLDYWIIDYESKIVV